MRGAVALEADPSACSPNVAAIGAPCCEASLQEATALEGEASLRRLGLPSPDAEAVPRRSGLWPQDAPQDQELARARSEVEALRSALAEARRGGGGAGGGGGAVGSRPGSPAPRAVRGEGGGGGGPRAAAAVEAEAGVAAPPPSGPGRGLLLPAAEPAPQEPEEGAEPATAFRRFVQTEESRMQDWFAKAVEDAKVGFRMSQIMDFSVFAIAIVVLLISPILAGAGASSNSPGLFWAGAGICAGVGVGGILFATLVLKPRKQVECSMDRLMHLQATFLGFLRQLHHIEQVYVQRMSDPAEKMELEEVERLSGLVTATTDRAVQHLGSFAQAPAGARGCCRAGLDWLAGSQGGRRKEPLTVAEMHTRATDLEEFVDQVLETLRRPGARLGVSVEEHASLAYRCTKAGARLLRLVGKGMPYAAELAEDAGCILKHCEEARSRVEEAVLTEVLADKRPSPAEKRPPPAGPGAGRDLRRVHPVAADAPPPMRVAPLRPPPRVEHPPPPPPEVAVALQAKQAT